MSDLYVESSRWLIRGSASGFAGLAQAGSQNVSNAADILGNDWSLAPPDREQLLHGGVATPFSTFPTLRLTFLPLRLCVSFFPILGASNVLPRKYFNLKEYILPNHRSSEKR